MARPLTSRQSLYLTRAYAQRLWGTNPAWEGVSRPCQTWGQQWAKGAGSAWAALEKRGFITRSTDGSGAGWGANQTTITVTPEGVTEARRILAESADSGCVV